MKRIGSTLLFDTENEAREAARKLGIPRPNKKPPPTPMPSGGITRKELHKRYKIGWLNRFR